MSNVEGYGYNFIDLVANDQQAEVRNAIAGGGGSLLMALAIMLGTIADKMLARTMSLAGDLDNLQAKKEESGEAAQKNDDGKGENQLTAELQAQTQLMSMFMQAMTTVIKTVGEANKDVARKQ